MLDEEQFEQEVFSLLKMEWGAKSERPDPGPGTQTDCLHRGTEARRGGRGWREVDPGARCQVVVNALLQGIVPSEFRNDVRKTARFQGGR